MDPMVLTAALHFVSQTQQAGQSVFITSWVELLTITVIVTGLSAFWHKHNCHEHGCLRLSWHPDEEGHPVCKKHHPDHPAQGLWTDLKHFLRTGHWGDETHPKHSHAKALKRQGRESAQP